MVWDSGSTGQADDQKLADAWKNGDIRDALSEDGLKDYSMRSAVQQGLMYYYNTGSPPYYDPLMEIAVVSLLQLLGSYSDSFLGFAGASYLDKYAQEDPGKSYNTYRSSFMDREMYAQLGSFEHNVIRAFPGFFRKYYEPFGRPAHLDTRFNDGFQNPDIGKNPYLTNATDMKFLAQTIIPRALNPV